MGGNKPVPTTPAAPVVIESEAGLLSDLQERGDLFPKGRPMTPEQAAEMQASLLRDHFATMTAIAEKGVEQTRNGPLSAKLADNLLQAKQSFAVWSRRNAKRSPID